MQTAESVDLVLVLAAYLDILAYSLLLLLGQLRSQLSAAL